MIKKTLLMLLVVLAVQTTSVAQDGLSACTDDQRDEILQLIANHQIVDHYRDIVDRYTEVATARTATLGESGVVLSTLQGKYDRTLVIIDDLDQLQNTWRDDVAVQFPNCQFADRITRTAGQLFDEMLITVMFLHLEIGDQVHGDGVNVDKYQAVGATHLSRLSPLADDFDQVADLVAGVTPTTVVDTEPTPTGFGDQAIGKAQSLIDSREAVQNDLVITSENAHDIVTLQVLEGHTNTVNSVAFNHDGTLLVSGSDDHTVRLWDVATGQELDVLRGHSENVEVVAFNPSGTLIASGGKDETVRLWDVTTGSLITVLRGHTGQVRTLAFTHDGAALASGGMGQYVIFWDAETGDQIARLDAYGTDVFIGSVWSTAFSLDNSTLAFGTDAGVQYWNLRSDRSSTFIETDGRVWELNFNSDGSLLATAIEGDEGGVSIWNTQTGERVFHFEDSVVGFFPTVDFSHDDTLLIFGDGLRIHVWDVEAAVELNQVRSEDGSIRSIDFSPDGTTFASSHFGQDIYMWGLPRG